MSVKLNLIFCVESGPLEQQAILLIESAKHWLKPNSYNLIAYSPRKNHYPSAKTLSLIKQHDVVWVSDELNTQLESYPIANKVLACKHFVEMNPKARNIMFLDTDTVFLNEINIDLLVPQRRIYLRPVDNKGPGSESLDDKNDKFWQQVFGLCGVPLPKATIKTTVRPVIIRNYFNAGLIWSQGIPEFFQQWYKDFMTILKSEFRPFAYESRDGNDFRCLDQVALAVTATRYKEELEVLPETYNYPLPFRPLMQLRPGHPNFAELVHVHYHKWFQHSEFIAHVANDKDKLSLQYQWLNHRLPINPLIDGVFKC